MNHWDDVTEDDFKKDEDMYLLVSEIGLEAAKKIVEIWGGDSVYIPKPESVIRMVRDRRIWSEFSDKGVEYDELAARYNLTPRHVREIIRVQRRLNRKIIEQQLEMF